MSSAGAKGGFKAEDTFISLVNNEWKTSEIVKSIFMDMGILVSDLETIEAFKPEGLSKTDCCIKISYKIKDDKNVHNISIKLASTKSNRGFNQIDKRWVDKGKGAEGYTELLGIPDDVKDLLKHYTGMLSPSSYVPTPTTLKDKRRLFINEMLPDDQIKLLSWLNTNIDPIFNLVFIGNSSSPYPAHFICMIKSDGINVKYKVFSIKDAITFYKGDCKASVSKRGTIHLGKLTIQRKGGDKGADTAKQLQIKFDPLAIL